MTDDPVDVLDLLVDQHRRIRELFDAVATAGDDVRPERFTELRRFLAVHETAEELVTHPRTREVAEGSEVVAARLAEERAAKVMLHELEQMDVADPLFATKLALLRSAVLDHAAQEEAEEFPLLREGTDAGERATLGRAVRAAEALAPTRPHPGVESLAANLALGPVASLVDRTRDVVREVLGRR